MTLSGIDASYHESRIIPLNYLELYDNFGIGGYAARSGAEGAVRAGHVTAESGRFEEIGLGIRLFMKTVLCL